MELPKLVKKAIAVGGIMSGLTGVSSGEVKKPDVTPHQPRTTSVAIDITKRPARFDPSTGEYNKGDEMAMMYNKAAEVCNVKSFSDLERMDMTVVDHGTSIGLNISCGKAREYVETMNPGRKSPKSR